MRAWQAPRLRDAWNYAANATVLKLDLKSTSQPALEALVRFVQARPSEQQFIFVSSDPDALAFLDAALPESIELLSLSSGRMSMRCSITMAESDGVDGISVPSWALTAGRIQSLKERGYLIDAWTVNDIERLVELSALGVDIITTDNLAFFDMALDAPPEESTGL